MKGVLRYCPTDAGRDKLSQVLLKIGSNSVKFTPAAGRVTVDYADGRTGQAGALHAVMCIGCIVGRAAGRLSAAHRVNKT
jgi:signal transduction histidine kinase